MIPFLSEMSQHDGVYTHTDANNTYMVTVIPGESIVAEFDKGVFTLSDSMATLVASLIENEAEFRELCTLFDMMRKHAARDIMFIERETNDGDILKNLVLQYVEPFKTHREFKECNVKWEGIFAMDDFPVLGH